MATTRKPRTPKAAVVALDELPATIEQIARSGHGQIKVDLTGTTEKVVTDRIRRLPRLKGWNAVTVKKVGTEGSIVELSITSTHTTAIPWPTKAAAPAKPAAKRAPAKRAAKPDAKPAAKRTRKAAAK